MSGKKQKDSFWETGIRAVNSEKRIREKSNNNILKECFKEIEKNRETGNKWEADGEMYFHRNGMPGLEVKKEGLRKEGLRKEGQLSK